MDEQSRNIKDLQLSRERVIVRTGIVGIAVNLLLVAFKAGVGLLSHSIAVILDAVNNLTDALGSLITVIGGKVSGKKPDRKHPLGHGRFEYISALVVAALVLYAGVTAAVESVKKIITPEKADYTIWSLVIIGVAVLVKLVLGLYVSKTGKRVNSSALAAAGKDALFDAVISVSVLISAVIYLKTGVSLEAYLGVAISAVIVKSGVEMIVETVNDILGRRTDPELSESIKATLCENEQVYGAYDLILHDYGPELLIGSVHVEIPDTMDAAEIDLLERQLGADVYKKHGVLLAAIGVYSHNTQDDEIKELRSGVTRLVSAHEGVLQLHGFYADKERKTVNLDVILDFALPDREASFAAIKNELTEAYPGWTFHLTMDIDA
ncbi:MAG: cation transporter [Clostridia bacterium]|nr:cation transporter [Clostridia bacterium]